MNQHLLGAWTCLGMAVTAALWFAGRWTPPPFWLGTLLGVALLLGLGQLVYSLRQPPRSAAMVAAGLLQVGAALLFVVLLFRAAAPVTLVRGKAQDPAGEMAHLRLVQFNVWHDYPAFHQHELRFTRLVAELRALAPTVIVLQEAWVTPRHGHLAERLGAALAMDVAYARANGSRQLIGFEEGAAILSRLPIRSAERWVLAPRRPFWETRIALQVVLAWGQDSTLTVIGTHLTAADHYPAAPRIAALQAADLAQRLPSGMLIVSGDWNALSPSAACQALVARGLHDLVPGGIDHVFARTVAPWRLVGADWALTADPVPPRDFQLSDHPGIVADWTREGLEQVQRAE